MLAIDNRARAPHALVETLRRQIAGQATLHDVVVAGLAQRPPRVIADVIVQDEYTHDVVLPWDHGLWLVYDAT